MQFIQSLPAYASKLSGWTDALVYVAIAAVTLIGLFKCLIPLWSATHAVNRASDKLETEFDPDSKEIPNWQSGSFMGKRLRGSWLRFLQNAEQLDRRGLPCDVENYINDDTVIYGPGNASLAELIPNLLTSLGILGTFMGMMQGLTGLDMGNAESLMDSIPTLLEGMRFAFGTSVAGISCSLVFNMLYHIAQGSGYRATDRFTETFTKLAMKRPLDNDVQIICQNQDRNHMLFNATDGLTAQVTQSIEGALNRVMIPVAQSMDRFLEGTTRNQIDGVSRIVEHFIRNMNESLSGRFLQLGELMTQINQNQSLCIAQVNTSVEAARGIAAEVASLQQVSDDLLHRFADYVNTIEAGRRHDARYEAGNTALLEQMNKLMSEQRLALQSLQALQAKLDGEMKAFTGESKAYLAGLQQAAGAQTQASRALSDGCTHFVTETLGGVTKSLNDFERSTQGMLSALSERVDTLSRTGGHDTAARLGEIQRTLTDLAETLKQTAHKEA